MNFYLFDLKTTQQEAVVTCMSVKIHFFISEKKLKNLHKLYITPWWRNDKSFQTIITDWTISLSYEPPEMKVCVLLEPDLMITQLLTMLLFKSTKEKMSLEITRSITLHSEFTLHTPDFPFKY